MVSVTCGDRLLKKSARRADSYAVAPLGATAGGSKFPGTSSRTIRSGAFSPPANFDAQQS